MRTKPSQALTKIDLHLDRIVRLREDKYKVPRLRTRDLNALVAEWKILSYLDSIAFFCNNKDRYTHTLKRMRAVRLEAMVYLDEVTFGRLPF